MRAVAAPRRRCCHLLDHGLLSPLVAGQQWHKDEGLRHSLATWLRRSLQRSRCSSVERAPWRYLEREVRKGREVELQRGAWGLCKNVSRHGWPSVNERARAVDERDVRRGTLDGDHPLAIYVGRFGHARVSPSPCLAALYGSARQSTPGTLSDMPLFQPRCPALPPALRGQPATRGQTG